jgi:hypothetical protein
LSAKRATDLEAAHEARLAECRNWIVARRTASLRVNVAADGRVDATLSSSPCARFAFCWSGIRQRWTPEDETRELRRIWLVSRDAVARTRVSASFVVRRAVEDVAMALLTKTNRWIGSRHEPVPGLWAAKLPLERTVADGTKGAHRLFDGDERWT